MSKYDELFTSSDITTMSQADFDEAIKGLIAKGIMEEVVVDGEVKYRMSKLVRGIAPHLNSNAKDQN